MKINSVSSETAVIRGQVGSTGGQGGGGGDGTGDVSGPTITDVVASTTPTTAYVHWKSSDTGSGVASCVFKYGTSSTTQSLQSVVLENDVDRWYETTTNSLNSNTTYFYTITCTDNKNNKTDLAGNFITLTEEGGGNGNPDNSALQISDIKINPLVTKANLEWKVNKPVKYEVYLGKEFRTFNEPGYPLSNNSFESGPFQVEFISLLPNTQYFFKIKVIDVDNNIFETESQGFLTQKDNIPPADVSSFSAQYINGKVKLSWGYSNSLSDFSRYNLVRNETGVNLLPDLTSWRENIFDINQKELLDSNVVSGKKYYYKIFVFDTSGNNSSGVLTSITLPVPPVNGSETACQDEIDNDQDGKTDCSDSDCSSNTACVTDVPPPGGGNGKEILCNDGLDNNSNGFADCNDIDCVGDAACQNIPVSKEVVCNDSVDNDNDTKTDCNDSDCSSFLGCKTPLDPNELQPQNTPNDITKEAGVNYEDKSGNLLQTKNFYFWLSERTIPALLSNNTLTSLSGDQITFGIKQDLFLSLGIKNISLILKDSNYNFSENTDGFYYADFVMPAPGTNVIYVLTNFLDGKIETLPITLKSSSYAIIRDKENKKAIEGAKITLYTVDGGEKIWDADNFRQINPQITKANGAYGFVVPNGKYKISIEKEGYKKTETFSFSVVNNIINQNQNLIILPITSLEKIDYTKEVMLEKTEQVIAKIEDYVLNPVNQKTIKNIVVPGAAVVTAAVVVPSLWGIILPLLRFLFLQPLLAIGIKKRKAWGEVYNSLTGMPIDLAIIRLLDGTTKRVIQSVVTDSKGRFMFVAKPGEYILDVTKKGLFFPSKLLMNFSSDNKRLDLYHGEKLIVNEENTIITPNIPLDPTEVPGKVPKRLFVGKLLRLLQHLLSFIGIVLSGVSLYFIPSWQTVIIFTAQIAIYIGFTVYTKPKKPKGWGIVYDLNSKRPIEKAVARLFSKKLNKLVATSFTDSKGRYAFLVGQNDYTVRFEKEGYDPEIKEVNIENEEGVIKENIGLHRPAQVN